jgi:uncharacterized membrane protein YjjP (DUF1212 family)
MEPTSKADDRDAVEFVTRLARALHSYGTPSHQVEDTLQGIARRLGTPAQFLATPTSIMISVGPQFSERVHLVRVEPGEQDLGKLSDVFDVANAVVRGEVAPAEGSARLAAIDRALPRYRALVVILAMALSSSAASRFLGGGVKELPVAAIIGLVIGLLSVVAARVKAVGRMFEFLAAVVASALAGAAAHIVGPMSVYLATLAGIIILIPGFTLTVALTELSNKHLVAGTARLFGAITTFIVIAVGVAIGSTLMAALLGDPALHAPLPLPGWTEALALGTAPLAFAVLLKARPRDAIWILLACGLGFAGTRLGSKVLGPELGVFVGAVVVGLAGSAYANLLKRPAAVLRVPGILLLVPGSIGFRSLTALLDRQVVPGVETAFKMITMATALAAGLLIASVVAPARITK